MSIKAITGMLIFSALLTACATGSYNAESIRGGLLADKSTTGMGVRYLLGRGVPQSDSKAFAYLKEAAEDNDPFAQNELAFLYASGRGTAKNPQKAFYWYQKSASHGLASAEYSLGQCYLYGFGTTVNTELAKAWLRKAATHGFTPANVLLSSIH